MPQWASWVPWWVPWWVPRWWRTNRVLTFVGDVVGDLVGIGGGDLTGRLGGYVIALEKEKSATSACIQSKYESNTPDGAPYRVKQEGSATTMNSTKDSRQRGKLVRYCPGRKKEIQRRVRALKSKYEVNNGPGIHGARVPLSHFGEALALSSRHLGSAEETDFKGGKTERTKKR